MVPIKKFKDYNYTTEDKILKFNDFEFKKYNSNILMDNIMLWLRNFKQKEVKVKLDDFLNQTKIDKDKFLTFVNDMNKLNKIDFNIDIIDDYITFSNLYSDKTKKVWETQI